MLKKQPIRTCIGCKNQNTKKSLLRIVKNENGIYLDFTGKANGRGAYVCDDISCIEKLIKTKALNRTFKCEIDSSVYSKIKEDFLDRSNKQN